MVDKMEKFQDILKGGSLDNILNYIVSNGDEQILEKYFAYDKEGRAKLINWENGQILCMAAENGNFAVIGPLIKAGVNIEKLNEDGSTALHLAFEGVNKSDVQEVETIKALLASGFDVNALNDSGKTALQYAIESERMGVVKELLNFGADVDLPDQEGRTALHYASSIGNIEIINDLCSKGAAVNVQDHGGNTALHEAIISRRGGAAKILIDKGFNVNVRNNNDETPLSIAVKNKDLNLVATLVKAGADTDLLKLSGLGKGANIERNLVSSGAFSDISQTVRDAMLESSLLISDINTVSNKRSAKQQIGQEEKKQRLNLPNKRKFEEPLSSNKRQK